MRRAALVITFVFALAGATAARAVQIRVVARSHLDVSLATDDAGVTVAGALADDRGTPVPGAELSITVGPLTERLATTDPQGHFTLTVTDADLEQALATGPRSLTVAARFGGDASRGPAENSATTAIERSPVTLDVAVAPPRAIPGQPVRAFAMAQGPRGPIAGIRLEAELGATTAVAVTDARGRAVFRSLEPPPPGLHTLHVRFAGTPRLAPSAAEKELTVVRRVSIVLDAPTSAPPLVGRVVGRVVADPPGPLLGQVAVDIAVVGSDGVGQVRARPAKDGRFTVDVDTDSLSLAYGPASAEVTLRYLPGASWEESAATPAPPLGIPGPPRLAASAYAAPIAAAVVALGAVWFLRRRRVVRPAPPPVAPHAPHAIGMRGPLPPPPPSGPGIVWGTVVHGLLSRAFEGVVVSFVPDGVVPALDGTGPDGAGPDGAGPDGTRPDGAELDEDRRSANGATSAVTDVWGRFALAAPVHAGVLLVTKPGFLPRSLPLAAGTAGAIGSPIVLTPLRALSLAAYRAVVAAILGPRGQFGRRTPRELEAAMTAATGRNTSDLTRAFEAAYFGGDAAMTDAKHARVTAAADRVTVAPKPAVGPVRS